MTTRVVAIISTMLGGCGSQARWTAEPALPTPEVRWEGWAQAVMTAWPSGEACAVPRERSGELEVAVAMLAPSDRRLRTIRYLALQCDLAEVQAAMVRDVAEEWANYVGYRTHCYAGGSGHDARCVALLAVSGTCLDAALADDPRCMAFARWGHQDTVTTNASVPDPSSATSTSVANPAWAAAASNSGK